MTLDAPTLLTASILVAGLMAGVHLTVWFQDRRETAILWMVAATGLCCASGLLRDLLSGDVAIVVVNVLLMIGLSCIGTACPGRRGPPRSASSARRRSGPRRAGFPLSSATGAFGWSWPRRAPVS